MRLIVLAIVTLVFQGWIYEYPAAMAIRDGKVVDAETFEEVKPARRVDLEQEPRPQGSGSTAIIKVGIT
jgi:hypothetical protein